jgi:hypothetical protein
MQNVQSPATDVTNMSECGYDAKLAGEAAD